MLMASLKVDNQRGLFTFNLAVGDNSSSIRCFSSDMTFCRVFILPFK